MKNQKQKQQKQSKQNIWDKKMTFQECELTILRHAVDEAEKKVGKMAVNSSDIKQIFSIVENFIRHKKTLTV